MPVEREYSRKFINEMATIGICDGKRVITNSLDHGQPHIHYGDIKIYLPKDLPKNQTELMSYVDNAYKNKISVKELTELVNWFSQPNRIQTKLNNFEASWTAWYLEHPEEL